ncbi:unnamed protein product [Rotaria socialis]|uniref:WD repeat-containing protein 65 n=3 Tax=Rotaria socialis TaxID=392032 RepID=A0A818AJR5_9BILA|nr:unnamed protein product [Rotaria socialis]CAF3404976.1 unnamed protein product [Rotaria socialis]
MSLLSIKHIFGIRTCLTDCIVYLNDHSYLYPSSRNIILYNIDHKCQRFISFEHEYDTLESLGVSSNKQYLAIALNKLDKTRIIIYDINEPLNREIQKQKILKLSQRIRSNHVLSIIFSANSKLILALCGAPDYMLICWSIDRFKYIAMVSLHFLHIDLSHNPLNLKISFNPKNCLEFLLTGNHIYRRYHINTDQFSPYGSGQYQRCELMNITCHCWLNENHILLGLDTGYICVVNNHEDILQQYHVTRGNETNNLNMRSSNAFSFDRFDIPNRSNLNINDENNLLKIKSSSQLSSRFLNDRRSSSEITLRECQIDQRSFSRYSSTSLHKNISKTESINSNHIICLLPFSRGVFVSIGEGCILMYERNENGIELTYLRRLVLPSYSINDFSIKKTQFHLNNRKKLQKKNSLKLFKQESIRNSLVFDSSLINQRLISNEIILSLSLSPNEETLLVATNFNNLYEIAFSKMDYTNKQASIFTYALDSLHQGTIITGSICLRKPIIFTLGTDRFIKIWNLQTNNQEFQYQFDIKPLSLSIHPSGIFVCVSFSTLMRIYTYTIDGFYLFKELEISDAQCIEYSHQGHILAIAYDNLLQFHYHNDYHQATYIRDNHAKIRLIRWSNDDSFLISVDFNDLMTRWDPYRSQSLFQYKILDFSVQDLVISSNNKLAYLLTSDKKIKEFHLMTTIRNINISIDDFIPTALAIDDEARILFVGSEKGSIYSINLMQTNAPDENNTMDHLLYENVHRGAITKILISHNNDLIISTGEDGNLILYNLNHSQENEESKIIFRDEVLVKEILLKEKNIELNNLIKHQSEITYEYKNKVVIKEKEYIENIHQFDLNCKKHISKMEIKLSVLHQHKIDLKNEYEQKLKKLIQDKKYLLNQFNQDKNNYYKNILIHNNSLKYNIKKLNINQHKQVELIYHSYRRRIDSIHLSYRDKMNNIKQNYFLENLDLNQRIDYLEEMKYSLDEDVFIELNDLDQQYIRKLKITFDRIQQLENEQILLKIRFEQLEQESNRFEGQTKEFEIERNQLIDQIQQIDKDLNSAKQTIEQRNSIIQEKLKRRNEMENRKDELEKFAYVFNYKIRELTSEMGPRQREVQALMEQFNNMDTEYDLLNQNNEKYSIKISASKARLRATEKELQYEINSTQIDLGQMSLFDCERQRAYFERTNQRLKTKISFDFQRQKIIHVRRIQEQISMMREISSYGLKVIEVERILTDLDIVSNVAFSMNATTSNEIVHALKIEHGSDFIESKQIEMNFIITNQVKRIEQLRDSIEILEENLRQTSKLNINYCISNDPSIVTSSNLMH